MNSILLFIGQVHYTQETGLQTERIPSPDAPLLTLTPGILAASTMFLDRPEIANFIVCGLLYNHISFHP
jgi:hypothetical protein